MPTIERHFVEFAKKDGYYAYFQDYFTSARPAFSCLPTPEMGGVDREAWRRHGEGEGADGRDGGRAPPLEVR